MSWAIWKATPKIKWITAQAQALKPNANYSSKKAGQFVGTERESLRLKNCGKVSSFEAMLSMEQKRDLAIGKVVPKNRKVLG